MEDTAIMQTENTSVSNARRLDDLNRNFMDLKSSFDEIRLVLKGSGEDNPGVFARMAIMERVIFGKENQERGMLYKVNVMFKVHYWLVGVVCTVFGVAADRIVQAIFK